MGSIFKGPFPFTEVEIPLDESRYEVNKVPSSYIHYLQDTEADLVKMLRNEYGNEGGSSYQVVLVKQCQAWLGQHQVALSHALHMGCGMASGTWQLAKIFDHVSLHVDLFFGHLVHIPSNIYGGHAFLTALFYSNLHSNHSSLL